VRLALPERRRYTCCVPTKIKLHIVSTRECSPSHTELSYERGYRGNDAYSCSRDAGGGALARNDGESVVVLRVHTLFLLTKLNP